MYFILNLNNQIIFDKQNKSKSLKKRSNNTFAFAEKTYVKFGNIAKSIKFKEYVLTKRFYFLGLISPGVSVPIQVPGGGPQDMGGHHMGAMASQYWRGLQ